MAPRKDIHRPSVIKPEDYEFVAYDYYGSGEEGLAMAGERKLFREHMARSGGKFSSHDHAGSCHVCGAGALFVGKFWHKPSNVYVVMGQDCAAKMEMGNPAAFKRFREGVKGEREAAAGKRKAAGILAEIGLAKAWELFANYEVERKAFAKVHKDWREANEDAEPNYDGVYEGAPKFPRDVSKDEFIVMDMVGKVIKYGDAPSGKAQDFLKLLLDRIERAPEIAAEKAAVKALEMANASPVPVVEGRVLVKGEVLSVKEQEGFYGIQIKMLVKSPDGFKLWGSVPSAIVDAVEKGSMVEFNASIKPSDDDKYFGFFSRPSKAKVLKALEARLR